MQECNEIARETQDSLEVHAIIAKFENIDSDVDILGKFVIKEDFIMYSADSSGKLTFRKQKPKHCLVILYTYRLFVFRRRR